MEQQHQFLLNENVELKARMSLLENNLEENVAAMFGYINDQKKGLMTIPLESYRFY